MSVELICVLLAVVALGVALRRLFLASSQRLGQDMARMESRLDGKISELRSQFESQINDLRDEVGELRARIVNYSGTAFVKLPTPPGTSRGSDASESQTSVEGSTPPIYTLDYPFNPSPRYVEGGRPYPLIYDLLNSGRESYYRLLSSFVQFKKDFLRIPQGQSRKWVRSAFLEK